MKKSINIWMQLLGFEKNDADRGASRYIDHIGFTPDNICALLFHSDFVNLHRGMECEYSLFTDNCAYHGIPRGTERERQNWTNYDLKILVKELKKHGVGFYAGIMGSYTHNLHHHEFLSDHPELRSAKLDEDRSLCCLKRFKDGSYYEDFFAKKLVKTLCDYDMDGVHLSDAFCPSNRIFVSDWSWDMTDQFISYSSVNLPPYVMNTSGDDSLSARKIRHEYIWQNHRRQLIDFYEWRWERFFKKVCNAVHAVGKKVWVLGMYCTDPFETRYMYGFDSKRVMDAGVDCITANILPTGATLVDPTACDFFYKIHLDLPLLRAQVGDKKLLSMVGIQDASEEWSILEHAPTRLERDIYTMTAFRRFDKNGCDNALDGLFLCLGDGISKSGWDFLNARFEKGFEAEADFSHSPVILWSDVASDKMLDEYIKNRRLSPIKQCHEIWQDGLAFGGAVRTDELEHFNGCLFVPNFDLLSDAEQKELLLKNIDFVATVPEKYAALPFTPDCQFTDGGMMVFARGVKTDIIISKNVTLTPSRAGETEREYNPLCEELPYSDMSQAFVSACSQLLAALMQKRFKVTSTVPMLALRLKNGKDRLYLYNADDKHYAHAIVTCECDAKAESEGFYPVLAPRYVDKKDTSFSFDCNSVKSRNKFQTKLAPAGVTIIDIKK